LAPLIFYCLPWPTKDTRAAHSSQWDFFSLFIFIFICMFFGNSRCQNWIQLYLFVCWRLGLAILGGFLQRWLKPIKKCRSPRPNRCQVEGAWRHILFVPVHCILFGFPILPYALSFYWHFVLRPLHFMFFSGVPPPWHQKVLNMWYYMIIFTVIDL